MSRIMLCVLLLLSLPAVAKEPVPKLAAAYYHESADDEILPQAKTYELALVGIKKTAMVIPTDEALAQGVFEEMNLMLASQHCSHLTLGLKPDLRLPFQIVERNEGDIRDGMVWLAACQGLIRGLDDPFSSFMRTEEYAAIPNCGGPANRPKPRPRFRIRQSR